MTTHISKPLTMAEAKDMADERLSEVIEAFLLIIYERERLARGADE